MQKRLALAGVALCAALTTPITGLAQKPVDLSVTVTYTGKGPVDATHEILVFLFPTPEITAESKPITFQSIAKSGGTAMFKAVSPETVYIAMVYDEKANYDGTSGPPPAGAPIGYHTRGGRMLPVKPAATPKIKATFDDSQRWK